MEASESFQELSRGSEVALEGAMHLDGACILGIMRDICRQRGIYIVHETQERLNPHCALHHPETVLFGPKLLWPVTWQDKQYYPFCV